MVKHFTFINWEDAKAKEVAKNGNKVPSRRISFNKKNPFFLLFSFSKGTSHQTKNEKFPVSVE